MNPFILIPLCALAFGQLSPGTAEVRHRMALVPAQQAVIGTSAGDREALARRYDCHPTWLGDDLPRQSVHLSGFWLDRHPVTNALYLAFVEATGHPRPDWWSRWGGVFPEGYADHTVVGVGGRDAAAYAQWAGKRLPTAAEWEVAVGSSERVLFAWGQNWPGPLKRARAERIYWQLPGTRPVGSGECGRSENGVEDFAGQVLEWVADSRPHHGVRFQLMKGASWFHEDPLNYPTTHCSPVCMRMARCWCPNPGGSRRGSCSGSWQATSTTCASARPGTSDDSPPAGVSPEWRLVKA